jgi:ubiquinone/menaquinone biosynthesis C-methylase UbiE
MTASRDKRLADQIRYYRHRAAEYDETSYFDLELVWPRVDAILDRLNPTGATLELACGTGVWTSRLAARVPSLLAVDTSPEVVAVARRRVGRDVEFVLADAFALPLRAAQFDTVFFAAWMSHVPTDRFAEFWTTLGRLLRPGGRAVFMDESPSRAHELYVDTDIVARETRDGVVHRAVKVFWSPSALEARLHELGWDADVAEDGDDWIVGSAHRRG